MTVDAVAWEPHFLDHLAPIWKALPDDAKGEFLIDPSMVDRAARRGVVARAISVDLRLPPSPDRRRRCLTASYGDMKKARRLGYGSFTFVEHGIGQAYLGDRRASISRHGSYSGGMDRDDVGLFLVPNEYSARLWRASYPRARTVVTGCAKLDDPPRRGPDGPRPTVAISFHWDCQVTRETESGWAYFRPSIEDLARRFDLLGHGHPRIIRSLERVYARYGIETVHDFEDVMTRADVYVCDNSSTIYEFASTDRPVVVLNPPVYRRNVNHGLRFWEAADVGVNCNHRDQLDDSVARAIHDTAEVRRAREKAVRLVYGDLDGLASSRASEAILGWLGE